MTLDTAQVVTKGEQKPDSLSFGLAESMPDPIIIMSGDTLDVIWVNLAAQNWLGKSKSALVGRSLSALDAGFADLELVAQKVAASASVIKGHNLDVSLELRKRLKIDKSLGGDTGVSYSVFTHQDDIIIMFSPQRGQSIIHDASGEVEAVHMFGHMLAHELKNPLAGIHGAVQLLEPCLTDSDNLELTALISSEVERIGRLADEMENFGASGSDAFENFNIHTVLRKALLLFQNAENQDIEFVQTYDPSLPVVYGSPDKLMQVVVNLLANAVDALRGEPEPTRIELQTVFQSGVRKRGIDGTMVALPIEVRIIDNGPGIPAQLLERIFMPFVTSKANGHGLGLALVSKIIEEHGGMISVQSKPGSTTFRILLPSHRKMKT